MLVNQWPQFDVTATSESLRKRRFLGAALGHRNVPAVIYMLCSSIQASGCWVLICPSNSRHNVQNSAESPSEASGQSTPLVHIFVLCSNVPVLACTRFQISCLLFVKKNKFPLTIGYAGRRRPRYNTEMCTNFLKFLIVQMHICRNPQTYV